MADPFGLIGLILWLSSLTGGGRERPPPPSPGPRVPMPGECPPGMQWDPGMNMCVPIVVAPPEHPMPPPGDIGPVPPPPAPATSLYSASLTKRAENAYVALMGDKNYCTSVKSPGTPVNTHVHEFKQAWNDEFPGDKGPINTSQYEAFWSERLSRVMKGPVPPGCTAPVPGPTPIPGPEPVPPSAGCPEGTVWNPASGKCEPKAWPAPTPATLPPFPGPGWEPDINPGPSPEVVKRAWYWNEQLWNYATHTIRKPFVQEMFGGRWMTFKAAEHPGGKMGTEAYRLKAGYAQPPAPGGEAGFQQPPPDRVVAPIRNVRRV